jgi:hypothetical protein
VKRGVAVTAPAAGAGGTVAGGAVVGGAGAAVVVGAAAVVVVVVAATTANVPSVADAPSQVEVTWSVPAVAVAGTVSVTENAPSLVVALANVTPPPTRAITCVLAVHVTVPLTVMVLPAAPDVGLTVTVPGTGADPAAVLSTSTPPPTSSGTSGTRAKRRRMELL